VCGVFVVGDRVGEWEVGSRVGWCERLLLGEKDGGLLGGKKEKEREMLSERS
jgi:hypothetical protein